MSADKSLRNEAYDRYIGDQYETEYAKSNEIR